MTNSKKDMNEKEWQAFSGEIGRVLLRVLQERGTTRQWLAEEMGYTQPAVSNTFNTKIPQRCWSGPMLLAVSRVLHIRLSDIIRAAEDKEESDAGVAMLFLKDYPPCSDERLGVLINYVAPRGISEEERRKYYTVEMMEVCSQELVDSYRSGKISDARLLHVFWTAIDAAGEHCNIWAALKNYLQSGQK